jgi:hypothetical protein
MSDLESALFPHDGPPVRNSRVPGGTSSAIRL